MNQEQALQALRYRRARTLLGLIGLFWLWVWFNGAALIQGLHHSPIHAVLALYALAVTVSVSLFAVLLTVLEMIITHPRYTTAVTAPLPNASTDARTTREFTQAQGPAEPPEPEQEAHWWYDKETWHDREIA